MSELSVSTVEMKKLLALIEKEAGDLGVRAHLAYQGGATVEEFNKMVHEAVEVHNLGEGLKPC